MNIVDFIFQLFSGKLQLSVEEFDKVKERVQGDLEKAKDNKIVKFLNSPYVLLLLPFLLPLLKKGIDSLINRWIGDQDEDGDADLADAIALISQKLLKNKNPNNG